ncbi:DUF302 domain-containing protein [Jannaschia aquimarina]|uniref:DUF302 domain-containing protein n=1 Tax=Jannaschia aquimarina TaxID=935700 RepID=A0A0D1CRP5_9RHOB|nr:DUF302 domain-containing protein [Jannaschia aquimarina]KIT17467.1 hypothetical protein jaqu_06550 [Jannaschia aquimarina]SNS75327.1 Uncharacterized conserved protein, DUF302 family [Jannaschia aquimarina]
MRRLSLCIAPAAFAALYLSAHPSAAQTPGENGIIRVESAHSVEVTADRYEDAARERGIRVFARHNHTEAAREYEETLSPTIVIAVGNPGYGTRFIRENQLAGIDFPPKALAYEDPQGRVWLAYNSAEYLYETIFARHGLDYPPEDVAFYADLLESLAEAATSP